MSLGSSVRYFADTLAPPRGLVLKAGKTIERIRHVVLQQLGNRFSISRIRPLGSYGKKTSIWFSMDIDILIYLNDEMPPFERFKQELDDVITLHLDEDCKQSSLAITFHVDGFKIDLLPATNFVYQHGYNGRKSREEIQVENALRYLRENPNVGSEDPSAFSSTLSEGAVKFEQQHSGFSHSLSRLAKFWSSTIGIPGFSRGRSSIMEYLGARAAEDEERLGSQDIVHGFRRFLEMVVRAQSLNIVWTMFYEIKDIPVDILCQRPLLLDPSNPFSNYLDGERGVFLGEMSPFAEVTLSRLDIAERKGGFPIAEIFEPQPIWAAVFIKSSSKLPRNFLITSERTSQQLLPHIQRRPGAKDVDTSVAKSYIFSFIDALTAAAKFEREERRSVAKIVHLKLQQFIWLGDWPLNEENHEDKHMTLTVPIGRESNEVIKISFDWVQE